MYPKLSFQYYKSSMVLAPTILFLHGFMGSSFDWQFFLLPLKKNFSILTLDLPGHGQTAKKTPSIASMNIESTSQEILSVLTYLKIDRCFLVGYSMGGRIALYLTCHYPERFLKVILESTSPGLDAKKERKKRIQIDQERANNIVQKGLSEFLKEWYNMPLFQSLKNISNSSKMLERRLQNSPNQLALSLLNMGTGNQPSLWSFLSNIFIPILILSGEKDLKFQKISKQMAKLLPKNQEVIFKNCGHNLHVESPQNFLEQIFQFFHI